MCAESVRKARCVVEAQGGKRLKKVLILNGVGTSGKGEFASRLAKYVPTIKYSIIDIVKEAADVLRWQGGKTEKDRKFLSDLLDLATEYNDSPYKDVASLVDAFKNELPEEVLIIDMREPKDIARAAKDFGAETILIRNPNVKKIESNHADRDVENYDYDYIIENNGTLEQLNDVVKNFVDYIKGSSSNILPSGAYCVFNPKGKMTMVFDCNKMLR